MGVNAGIIEEGQVSLNSVRYALAAGTKVRRQLLSRFPAKVDIGTTDYGNELLRSNWIINDQRGGIGVEEMDESIHVDRCWFSTCNLDHAGHILPQPLATAIPTPAALITITGHTDGSGGWVDPTNAYDGDLTTPATYGLGASIGWSPYLQFDFTAATMVGLKVQARASNSNVNNMEVDYTVNGTDWTNAITVDPSTTSTARAASMNVASVTAIRIRFYNSAAVGGYTGYIYEVQPFTTGTITTYARCNFNGNTYHAINRILCKVNSSSGATLTPVHYLPANITDLISTIGTQMAVLMGDSQAFQYMSTAEVLTATDETGAYFGIHWDGKFFWINSTGTQLSYCTAFAATLSETDNGALPESVTVNGIMIYADTSGDDIIYVGTKNKFWAHDFANAKFTETKLDFAEHVNACKGMVNWNGDAYISMGLHVKRYSVGASSATASSVGLDKDDGVPVEYAGEIVSFIKDSEQFYGLVDSTQYGTSGYSWVAKWNGTGWQCLWADASTNKAMHGGIVSTVYSRALWFDCGNTIYKIPLQRTKILPKKNTSYTYAASAFHVTPWFKGGSAVFDKLALALKTFALDLDTDETIVIKYRVNRATTAIASTWTTLATYNTTSFNNDYTNKFTTTNTGDGKVFSSIQFRFDLARGTTSTNAPDLQAVVMPFIKLDDILFAWTMTLDLAGIGGAAPHSLLTSLETALATQILMPFIYRPVDVATDTHYVRIHPYSDLTPTGRNYTGTVQLTVYDPSPS